VVIASLERQRATGNARFAQLLAACGRNTSQAAASERGGSFLSARAVLEDG
jgi:hypothetical protein